MGKSGNLTSRGRPDEGRIELRANGKYRARIMRDGQRHSRTFCDRISAETWLIELRKKHISGTLPAHLKAKAITLSDGMDKSLREIPPGRYHIDTENKMDHLKRTEKELCGAVLANITRGDLIDFIARRRKSGGANATINRDLTIIRSVYRKAVKDWGCEGLANPAASLTAGKENERDRRPAPFELEALRRAAHEYLASPSTKTTVPIEQVIDFAASTGFRLMELGHLTWGDVNWHRSTVMVRNGKGGKKRLVPIFPAALNLLYAMGGGAPGALVFGKPNALSKAWQTVRALANESCSSLKPGNYDNLRLHDLRHEAVSCLYERTDLADGAISAIVGHDDPRSTRRYKHIRNAVLAPRLAEAEKRYLEAQALNPGPVIDADFESQSSASAALRTAWRATSTSKEAMQRLINSMPILQIAKLYGVSDAAVHKACNRLGITKKSPGHWARAKSHASQSAGEPLSIYS